MPHEIDDIVLIKPLVKTGIIESGPIDIGGKLYYYVFIESSRFLERYPEEALEKGEIKDTSKLDVSVSTIWGKG